MSVWVEPSNLSLRRPRDPIAVATGVAVLVGGLALLIWEARFRVTEARVSAWVLRLVHIHPAVTFGTSVVFPLHNHWVGYQLDIACTAALLMVPFFAVAGLLMVFGRTRSRRALFALAITSAVIFAVNQLRLLMIASSMRWWGFQTGYDRSHIFMGTILSTVGVIVGIVVFVWMLVDHPGRLPSGGARG